MNNDENRVTGSIDSIDNKPILRAEKEDIELILDEWQKRSKIKTRLSRDELKRMIIKTGDYDYKLELPVKDIINETIPLYISVSPTLLDFNIPVPPLIKDIDKEQQQQQQQQQEEEEEEQG